MAGTHQNSLPALIAHKTLFYMHFFFPARKLAKMFPFNEMQGEYLIQPYYPGVMNGLLCVLILTLKKYMKETHALCEV